jgi:hypothetical protein
MSGQREPSARTEPVGKLSNRIEAFDAQEAFKLRECIKVLSTRRTGRERAASRQPVDSKASLELIEEEADLRLCPYANDPDPELSATTRDPRFQELIKIRVRKVVEGEGVNDVLVRALRCHLVQIQDQICPPGAPHTVLPEGTQMIALGRIVCVMPITDMNDLDFL